jgi:carbonic anhydrase
VTFSWEPFGMARGEGAAAPRRPAALAREPRRGLVVLTCMDARVDPLGGFGLRLGDAQVLRNAGAEVTDDVLRAIRLSHGALGTRKAWLVGHTDCLAHGGDDERVTACLRRGAALLRPGFPDGFEVSAFVYDLSSGRLEPVPEEDRR